MQSPTIIINFKLRTYKRLKQTSWANPKILNGTREVSIIDENYPDNNYPILCSNNERYSLNGKHQGGGQSLTIYHNKRNPIREGRIVDNYTFAVRFKSFLEGIEVCDACSEDELEMLRNVAEDLLEWQIETVTDQEEKNYLQRLGLI